MMRILCLMFLLQQAQAQSTISGRISGRVSKPLSSVSVVLLQNSKFMGGDVSDSLGSFSISASCALNTTYTLKMSLVGYQPLTVNFVYPDSCFALVLKEDSLLLSEVTVLARKPLLTRKADRYIVNVENSYLANGRSGLEVLQQAPGLWVDGSGNIRLKGNQSVTVMINDVIQRMSESELADYLRTLRSEDISRIEIIPNPPGEFEASATGGIVHIILKRNRKDGITGTVNALYRQQGNRPYASAGTALNFNRKNLYLTGTYSYTNDRSQYTGYTRVSYPDKTMLNSEGFRNNNNSRQQYRFALTYDFSPAHSLNLQTVGTASALLQYFYSGIEYQEKFRTTRGEAHTDWIRHPFLHSTTASYAWKMDTLGSVLKVLADFTGNNKSESNTLHSLYDDSSRNSLRRTNAPSTTSIQSLQADYSRVLNKSTSWNTGVKYVSTRRHNQIIAENFAGGDWINNQQAGNNFRYTEKLVMGYLSFEKTIGPTRIKSGLRGEQTYSQGRSVNSGERISREYFGLFPSLFISQNLNEAKGNSMQLSYSRRVRRPGYNDLNPYRLQLNDYNILIGNPDLQPQFAHNIEWGYTLRNNYTAGIYFSGIQQYIAQTAATIDSNVIEYQSKNFRGSSEFGLTLNATNTVTKIWNINTSFLVYRVVAALNPTLRQTSYSIKSTHTIAVRKIMEISIYAEYNAPYLTANARQAAIFNSELGVSRKMGNGRLRLYLTDVFNTAREKELTEYNRTRIDFYQKRPTRTLSISYTYNFKAGKSFTQKKAEQNNSEEKNRL